MIINNAAVKARISYLIAQIDLLITKQVNEILHNCSLQNLESSWRSIAELASQSTSQTMVRLLDSKLYELVQDVNSKLEFDQTYLFDKIYSAEFGMPGGKPYTLLIGDYYFDLKSVQHMLLLTSISQIAAAAFVPFISSIDTNCLNIESYATLLRTKNINKLTLTKEYQSWQKFRTSDDARFVGLILPKVLMRQRYDAKNYSNSMFQFKEYSDQNGTLWGHSAYLFALSIMHCFKQTKWFDDLNRVAFNFMPYWQHTDYFLDSISEDILNQLGFMTLIQRGYTHTIYCYNSFSVQVAKTYDTEQANLNAKISTILKYILCAARFAHYIKIIAREKIGNFQNSIDLQNYLNTWIGQYVAANEVADKIRPIYPLKDAQVTVINQPGKNRFYQCIIRLVPRLDIESANFTLQLVTNLENN